VLHVPIEEVLDPVGVELAAHLGGTVLRDRLGGGAIGLLGLAGAELTEQFLAPLRPGLDEEPMLSI
jgi:hypothetical protein